MRCVQCGGPMVVTGDTHRYDESGLPDVVLKGVETRSCKNCGEREVAIPNIEGLHRALAQALICRASLLTGAEVRFLRKFLGYSGQDFARLMGVTAETVSRWENGKKPLGPVADRTLRLLVLLGHPVEDYAGLDFLKHISPKPPKRPRVSLRLKRNHWQVGSAA